MIRDGQWYRHVQTGGAYYVVAIATEEATEQPVVVYHGRQDGRYWTRPLGEFSDGRFVLMSEFSSTLISIVDGPI